MRRGPVTYCCPSALLLLLLLLPYSTPPPTVTPHPGNLVSNAPHLPVHLGAMSEAVKYQIKHYSPARGRAEHGLKVGAVPCRAVPCRAVPCRAVPCRAVPCRAVPCHVGAGFGHACMWGRPIPESGVWLLLQEGDVLVSNHPQLAGGSHLPDITVITPVFNQGQVVFFVASRGHHAGERISLPAPAAP